MAIRKQQFPEWDFSPETYFLSCLLHDIGTAEDEIASTLLSFEFHGGFVSHNILQRLDAPKEQIESVVEAIIRHQDISEKGTITRNGLLIQLATIFGMS
jgi:cyanamide hydratase